MSKKIFLGSAILFLVLVLGTGSTQAVTSTLTASQTQANVADTMDTTGLATSTTQANVTGLTKASTTLNFTAAPASSTPATYLTVGSCTITFATTTAGVSNRDGVSTADDLNCTGGATILLATTTNDTALSASQIAQELRGLTNVTDSVNGHGALTVGGTGSYVTFQTTGLEASSSLILIIDGTGGSKFSTTTSAVGVKKETQTQTITVGGTIATNNVYTVRSNGFSASYTAKATDKTAANIATGLNGAITAASPTEYTNSVSDTVITLTAVTAGTAFDPATTTVARTQQITFTPANVTVNENFNVTVGSSNYYYTSLSDDGVAEVTAGLATFMMNESAADCVDNSTDITCTAKTAGTGFAYSASVTANTSPSESGSSGSYYSAPAAPVVAKPNLTTAPTLSTPIVITRTWSYGKTGKEVKLLQEKLKTLGYLKKTLKTTNYFGALTKSAIIKFQKANNIKPANGILNTKTRALLNTL